MNQQSNPKKKSTTMETIAKLRSQGLTDKQIAYVLATFGATKDDEESPV